VKTDLGETAMTRDNLALNNQRVNTGQLWSTLVKGGQQWSNRIFYTISGRWSLYRNPKIA